MRVLSYIILTSLIIGCKPKSNITTLNLSNQNLRIIPDSVFSLTQLRSLHLGNEFTLYPPLSRTPEHYSDKKLNKIKSIPKEIANLGALRLLNLCYNDLKTLPFELTTLKKLDTLDISFNFDLKIESELKILKQMKWLNYLNIIATDFDENTVKKLRAALPNTKIDMKLETPKLNLAH